jgi:hypothetical protein
MGKRHAQKHSIFELHAFSKQDDKVVVFSPENNPQKLEYFICGEKNDGSSKEK